MRYFWTTLLMMPMIFSATSELAQGNGDNEFDSPFQEEQQRVEFKQTETKRQTGQLEPAPIVQPGPEGGPGQALMLLKDRLQVLKDNRASAVQQNKSPEEIAQIDAQINSIQDQIAPLRSAQ